MAATTVLTGDLIEELYGQLRRIARLHLRKERAGHTLQPTALVHEALLRMRPEGYAEGEKEKFFAAASVAMRRVLIDYARARNVRQGTGLHVEIDASIEAHPALRALSMEQLLTVDGAVEELREMDGRQADILEMRFFGGLTVEEIGEAMGISSRTVKREWQCARAWLLARMGEEE